MPPAEIKSLSFSIIEHIVKIGGTSTSPGIEIIGTITVFTAVEDIIINLEIAASHRVMNITSSTVLHQVITDYPEVKMNTA